MAARPSIVAVTDAARRRHGPGIAAVLFYGSCLRDGYDAADRRPLSAGGRLRRAPRPLMRWLNRAVAAQRLLRRGAVRGRTVRAKYALVTPGQFERLVGRGTCILFLGALCPADDRALGARRRRCGAGAQALATAVATTTGRRGRCSRRMPTARALWARAFTEAYRTELRAEAPERGDALYRGVRRALRRDHADPVRLRRGALRAARQASGGARTEVAAAADRGQDASRCCA